jgi:hypothetical protein
MQFQIEIVELETATLLFQAGMMQFEIGMIQF